MKLGLPRLSSVACKADTRSRADTRTQSWKQMGDHGHCGGYTKGQVIDLWQDGLEHGTFGWPLPPVLISNIPVVVGRGYEGVAHEGYVGAAR